MSRSKIAKGSCWLNTEGWIYSSASGIGCGSLNGLVQVPSSGVDEVRHKSQLVSNEFIVVNFFRGYLEPFNSVSVGKLICNRVLNCSLCLGVAK